jgi:hypothetical protein
MVAIKNKMEIEKFVISLPKSSVMIGGLGLSLPAV